MAVVFDCCSKQGVALVKLLLQSISQELSVSFLSKILVVDTALKGNRYKVFSCESS